MINDYESIKHLIPVEVSGLSAETDLNLEKKEKYFNILKNQINENTKNILKPSDLLNRDGCVFLGNLLNAQETKNELSNFPIYKGHIKNNLYSDGIPIYDYWDNQTLNGIYCWSMKDLITCSSIANIASSPLIIDFVSNYLGCLPTCYGINCMLSSGVSGHGTTSRHRDLDDFKFVSLFIYLDDINLSNGPHVYETGTHKGVPNAEVGSVLTPIDKNPKILMGNAGDGFLEDNWGIHYGMTLHPNKTRTCLWIRYGLYDNYTARHSVYLKDQKSDNHKFNFNNEITNYVFRFLQ
tara:strand:+ start:8066 stop:8947 length:882 start_codon:yes stop_codon:yes gene_type:complete